MSSTGMNRYQMLVNAMHTVLKTTTDEVTKNVVLMALREAHEIPKEPVH